MASDDILFVVLTLKRCGTSLVIPGRVILSHDPILEPLFMAKTLVTLFRDRNPHSSRSSPLKQSAVFWHPTHWTTLIGVLMADAPRTTIYLSAFVMTMYPDV